MRLTKQQVAELERHRKVLTNDRAALVRLCEDFWKDAQVRLEGVNQHVRAYNDRLAEAKAFVEGVAGELRDAYEEKSDRWKEGDAGQAADSMASEWENAEGLDDMDEIELVEPDWPTDDDDLLQLPEETE